MWTHHSLSIHQVTSPGHLLSPEQKYNIKWKGVPNHTPPPPLLACSTTQLLCYYQTILFTDTFPTPSEIFFSWAGEEGSADNGRGLLSIGISSLIAESISSPSDASSSACVNGKGGGDNPSAGQPSSKSGWTESGVARFLLLELWTTLRDLLLFCFTWHDWPLEDAGILETFLRFGPNGRFSFSNSSLNCFSAFLAVVASPDVFVVCVYIQRWWHHVHITNNLDTSGPTPQVDSSAAHM